MIEFDGNTDEEDAIRSAILQGKRMALESFQDLLQADPLHLNKAIQLLRTAIDEIPDITPHVIGVINEHAGKTWLFFQPNDQIFDGADTITISLENPSLDDSDPDNIDIEHDIWCIISREPLLIRSMYGAILGFKKSVAGVACHTVDEGDADDWGFEV